MNTENLNLVLQNYIDKFDEMNGETHNETYKWVALEHFRKTWDIEASNFAAMFKEAVSKTENLIDTGKVLPTVGIVRLAKREPEAVRASFRQLFRKDSGVLQERQERIDRFVTEMKELMEKSEPVTSKYVQDRRTAIMYLNLRYPDENYMFKSTEAKKFADCVEYEDSWGSGQSFKLGRYYKMCDNLVRAIEEHPELLSVHRAGRKGQRYEDRKYHILAYDIIYCAHHYDLYENIVIKPKTKKTAKSTNGEISQKMRADLQTEYDAVQAALLELDSEKLGLEDVSVKGLMVTNKTYGKGEVLEQDGQYLVVKFEGGERRFALPDAFAGGYLVTEDAHIAEMCSKEAEVNKKISDLKLQLSTLEAKMKKADG